MKTASLLTQEIDLTPNCLMTRFPIVFGSGHQSFFYTQRYWYFYPEYLAEHGYSVFHFNFPNQLSPILKEKLENNFSERLRVGEKWHLIIEPNRFNDLANWNLLSHPLFASISILSERAQPKGLQLPIHIQWLVVEKQKTNQTPLLSSYKFHQWIKGAKAPSPDIVGLVPESQKKIAQILLNRMLQLAENDFEQYEMVSTK